MGKKDYKLYSSHRLSSMGTNKTTYSIYTDAVERIVIIIEQKSGCFSTSNKEVSIGYIKNLMESCQQDMNNAHPGIVQMNKIEYDELNEVLKSYNEANKVFENYNELTKSLEDIEAEASKSKKPKI